jgi:hypothetical protein
MLIIALLTCGAVKADPVPQFGVTAVNANGNSLYNVTLTPNAIPNTGALITGTTQLNTDAAAHGEFFAVVRAPNSFTSALDLIVADATRGQIVRYAGPGPTYQPSTTIFNFSAQSPGPSNTTGLAVDVAGNLFVTSAGVPSQSKPALWVLPFNKNTGAYGAPVLIDNVFHGVKNCGSVNEVVVANVAASPVGAAAPAWNQGDVLVLANGTSGGASVLVYSQAAIAGVLNNPGVPLSGPTSILISSLSGEKPTGIDLWPADPTYPASGHGVSVLLPTASGRVMRYDSSIAAFTQDFTDGLGTGLRKIKVGVYSTFPYAFLAQTQPGTGRIMQFGAPPASGPNPPLSSVSTGVNDPEGLAVTNSASVPVGNCIAPNTCSPLGEQLMTQIEATNLNPNNPVTEQSCVINADPRVTASIIAGTWSCAGGTIDVANFCAGFPSTIVPASLCGHSGPTGSGFIVYKITGIAVDEDPNLNNSFIQNTVDATQPLPGPLDLVCPQLPIFAWAPRSDLPSVEGSIVEGNTFIDLTGFCDNGGGNVHSISMMAEGLGLNSSPSGLPNGLPGHVDTKFNNLTQTITNAGTQVNDGGTTQGYVTQAQSYFDAGVKNNDLNSYGCAMNTLATADAYVRGNPAHFSGLAPPGNINPAGEFDARMANAFAYIGVYFLNQPPNKEWPTSNVPPCMTFTASPTTVVLPGSAQLMWSSTGSYPASSCILSASDGTFTTQMAFAGPSGTASTGPLSTLGTYSAQLVCSNSVNGTISGFAETTVHVIQLSSISVGPSAPPPQIAAGGSVQLSATGTYSDQSMQNVTSSVNWTSSDPTSATVSGGLVTCISTAATAKQVLISAVGATAKGTLVVTCLAPTLTSVTLAPQTATLAAGTKVQLTATANYSYGPPQNVTSSASWASSNSSVATVSAGLVTCVSTASQPPPVTITATSGNVQGSTTVNCLAPVLQSISVTPQSSGESGEIPNGGTQQMTATATYSFGPAQNVTSVATWSSSVPSVATVSASGLLSCKRRFTDGDGNTTISATIGNTRGSSNITCEGLGD